MRNRHIISVCLVLLLFFPFVALAQSDITYQYWIDDNKDDATIGTTTDSGSGGGINLNIDVGFEGLALNPGVHFYTIRFYEEPLPGSLSGPEWSAPQRYIFSIPAVPDDVEPSYIASYEYWLDDDYDGRAVVEVSVEDFEEHTTGVVPIDVSSLSPGVHYYNVRILGTDEKWSTTQRYIFSIPAISSDESPANLKTYQYWIDDDLANAVSVTISGTEYPTADTEFAEIDLSDYAPGVHYYNMRVQDEDGIWSAPQRYIFSIPAPQQATVDKQLTGYMYAFNSDALKSVTFASPVDEFEQSIQFNVPSPGALMVVDDSCKFEFDATNSSVKMRRYTPMQFTLFFEDQNNVLSAPLVEEIVVKDSLTENVEAITSPGTYPVVTHTEGGFSAMSFSVTTSTALALRTSGDCGLRLYNADGTLLNAYDSSALQTGVSGTFDAGTYYAIIFGNTEAIKLALYPGDTAGMNALKPTITYDETTQIATITGDVAGASYYYTMNGDNPTIESTPYTEPFEVVNNATIKAIAAWGDMVVSPHFSYVVSTIKGDVSGDGVIDMQDVVSIIQYILGNPPTYFADNLADMNGDGVVDIFDAMLLVNYVLAHPSSPSGSRMLNRGEYNELTEAIALTADQDGIYMGIDQAERFTAFQFDLCLPKDVELSDVKLVSESSAHRLMFTDNGGNTYRVIGFSMNNSLFPSTDGKFLELQITNATSDDVMIDNVLFVTPELKKVYFVGGTIGTTAIENIETDSEATDIYNLKGQKLDNNRKQLDKGVYIINHKKVIIK